LFKRKYRYYIYFIHSSGSGTTFITTTKKIKTFSDIKEINQKITKESNELEKVSVVIWRKLKY